MYYYCLSNKSIKQITGIYLYNEHHNSTNPQSRHIRRYFPAHQGIYRTGEHSV